MTMVWPQPRSILPVDGRVAASELGGGPAATFDLLRSGAISPLFDDDYCIAGLESAELRAKALSHLTTRDAVVGLESAAWIHTGLGAIRKVFMWQSRSRHRLSPHRLRTVRSRELEAADITTIAGVSVTSVRRTYWDLRHMTDPDPETLDALARLYASG